MLKKQFLGAKIQIFLKRFLVLIANIFYFIPNLLGHPVEADESLFSTWSLLTM